MSAEPSNPSGTPGRNRPQLSDLSRETTEDDLWNLDEEPAAARPRQPKLTPPPPASPKEPAAPAEPPGTVEPPMPRGLASPAKPLTPRPPKPDEIGDLDESESEPAASDEVVTTLTSPIDDEGDEEEKKPKPATPSATSKPKTKAKAKIPAASKAKTPAVSQVDTPAAPVEVPAPVVETPPAQPEPKTEEAVVEEYADLCEQPYEDPVEEPVAHPAPRENRPRSAAPAAAASSLPGPRLNRREVIGIASFAVVVMITAVWVLSHFFSQLSFTRDSDGKPSYPLKGELARVASGTTFWREPVRSGENRDVARREVILIPVLELALDPEHSGGGALRVIFRNSEGQPLGDPITRSFGAGRFEASGNATITFAATDGFTTDGDFQAYRTGKGKLWTADVLEGPPGNGPASAFKKLSSIPILPDRR